METKEIARHLDHTALGACATWADISKLCDEALEYGTASVCIAPAFVSRVKETYGNKIRICTVIGFPLGYSTTATKLFEARDALANGADELDMVVNLGAVKEGRFDAVTGEIRAIKEACGTRILKVIIEACYLTDAEKRTLCKCVTEGGADYIKTSTGFGSGGATLEDVALFRENIGPAVKIKAAGGIRTLDALVGFIEAGCERIGTSAAAKLLAN